MIPRIPVILAASLLLGGCASIDGVYLPSCEAYSGSEIRLAEGRFHWARFTDQVVIDEDGNEIDQFPGFPLEGVYRVSGEVVTLVPDAGESPQVLYVQQDGDDVFLISAAEKASFDASGERPRCALQRQSVGT